VACSGDSAVGLGQDINTVYWSLRTSTEAATMLVGTTLQLTSTPLSAVQQPLSGLPATTYTTSDSEKVSVSPTGLLTAVRVTGATPITIIAKMTVDGITNADTIPVLVVSTAHTFASLSIQPTPGDSAKAGLSTTKPLDVVALDSAGLPLVSPNIIIKFRSLNTAVATVSSSGVISAVTKGQTTIIASTTSYGVTKSDTLQFTIGNPAAAQITLFGNSFPTIPPVNPAVTVVGVYATVTFAKSVGYSAVATTDITFDSLTDNIVNVSGGGTGPNIVGLANAPVNAQRKFMAPGTYTFKEGLLSNPGKIIVIP
jgi:hypothetical protein